MHGFVVFFLFISALSTEPFVYGECNGFSSELIHRDSPLSPFYNSSKSLSELMRNAVSRSISRVSRSLLSNENESPESITFPDDATAEYLMRIYIGTPPVENLVIADTGSDLVWVQCSPCDTNNCFPQDTPYFDPTKSSTFTIVPYDSQACEYISPENRNRGNSGQCEYGYSYFDKSYTYGELGIDSNNFGDNVSVKFPKSIFGCGHNNSIMTPGIQKTTGLVGLGAGPLSLVTQLGYFIGHKFSYCLVPFDSNTTSKIKFGSESTISENGVVSTPLIIKSPLPYYLLNLEGVTIGQKTIQTASQTNNNIGGIMMIDSGAPFTFLEQNLYTDFVTLLKETLIGVEVVQNPTDSFSICFKYGTDQMNFPDVVFHFTGADVTLMPINLIFPLENNMSCLMVEPTRVGGIPTFGNRAQVNFQVGYDLEGKTISFSPTDCTNF